jgi:hypothetical protein
MPPRKVERLEDSFYHLESRDGEARILRDPWGGFDRWLPVPASGARRGYALVIDGREYEFDRPHSKTVTKGRCKEVVLIEPGLASTLKPTA